MNEEEKSLNELSNEESDTIKDQILSFLKTFFIICISIVMLFAAVFMFGITCILKENSKPVQIPQMKDDTGTYTDVSTDNMSDTFNNYYTSSLYYKDIDYLSIELSYYLNSSVSELTEMFGEKTRSYRLFKGWDETKSVHAILPNDLPFYIICSSEDLLESPVCIGFYKEQSGEILSALNLTSDMKFEDIVKELNIIYAKDKDYESAKEYDGITYYSVSYHVKQGMVYHFVADNPQGDDFLIFAQCEYPPIQSDIKIQNIYDENKADYNTANLDSWIGSYKYELAHASTGIVDSTPFLQYNIEIFKCQEQYYARFENNGLQIESSFLARITGDENCIKFHYIQECTHSPSYYIEYFDEGELLLEFKKENDKLLTTWYSMADYHNNFNHQSEKITGEYYLPTISYGIVDSLKNKYSNQYAFVDYQTLPTEQFYIALYLDSFMAQFQALDNLESYNDFYLKFHHYFDNNALLEKFIEFGQDMKNGKVNILKKYCNMQPISLQSILLQPQIVTSENNSTNLAMIVYYELPLNDNELESGYSLIEFTVKRSTTTEEGVQWKITDLKEIGRNSMVKVIQTDED